MQDDAFINVAEAALRLGISEDTVKRRIRRGELKGKQAPRPQGYVWLVDVREGFTTTAQQDAAHNAGAPQDDAKTQNTTKQHDAIDDVGRLEELVGVLQFQLAAQQKHIESLLATQQEELGAKNNQIEQLHILLQRAQQAALPAPKENRRSWWRFWRS